MAHLPGSGRSTLSHLNGIGSRHDQCGRAVKGTAEYTSQGEEAVKGHYQAPEQGNRKDHIAISDVQDNDVQ